MAFMGLDVADIADVVLEETDAAGALDNVSAMTCAAACAAAGAVAYGATTTASSSDTQQDARDEARAATHIQRVVRGRLSRSRCAALRNVQSIGAMECEDSKDRSARLEPPSFSREVSVLSVKDEPSFSREVSVLSVKDEVEDEVFGQSESREVIRIPPSFIEEAGSPPSFVVEV
jgi:hypothetical protein